MTVSPHFPLRGRPSLLAIAGMFVLSVGFLASPAPAAEPSVPGQTHYGAWRSSRIGGGGYVSNLIPTSDPKIYYLHTDVGGFYRSEDGGANWRMLQGKLPATAGNQQPRGLLVDPRDPNQILVATGSHWENKPEGIYRSSDGGQTFERTLEAAFAGNGNTRMWGEILSVDPANPDVVLAASMNDGVFRSQDFGRTWLNVGLTGLNPTDIDFDKTQPGRVLLSAQPYDSFFQGNPQMKLRGGLFVSSDAGATWEEIKQAVPPPNELTQAPAAFGSAWIGVFRNSLVKSSKDGGKTWQEFGEGLPTRPDTDTKTSLSPTAPYTFTAITAGPDFLLLGAGDGKLYRRNPQDAAWTRIESATKAPDFWYGNPGNRSGWVHFGKAMSTLRVDPHDPNRWWLGDWYMLWQSNSGGKQWDYAGNGIEVTVVHNVTQTPDDPGHVHLGMADNGYFSSPDGGATFQQNWRVITNNIKDVAVSAKDPTRTYAIGPMENGPWHSNQLFVSDDRGATWRKAAMQGLRSADSRRMNSLTLDPTDKDRVFVALAGEPGTGGGVFQSEDAGETWKPISSGLPDEGLFQAEIWHVGRELAASQDGSLVAISSYKSRVFHRSPGTQLWAEATEKFGKINSVEADPFVPGRYLIASPTSGLHESSDSGATWTRLNPDSPAHHVTFDKAVAGRIAVGTSDGVALSTDAGQTWRLLDKELPNRAANSVAFAGDRLIVGTGGCGAFWIPLAEGGGQAVAARHFAEVAAVPDKELLTNGNFDDPSGDALAGWALRWASVKGVDLRSDLSTQASKPTALVLEIPSDGIGVVELRLPDDLGGKRIKVSGKIRAEGEFSELFVAIQSFDDSDKQNAWVNVFDGSKQQFDWTTFEKAVKVPSQSSRVFLLIHAKGTGSVWLDDASVLETER